jgi:flagellar hook-length control protein FliK
MKEIVIAINNEKQEFLGMFQMDQNKVNDLLANLQLDSENQETVEMTENVEEFSISKIAVQKEELVIEGQDAHTETVIQPVKSEENTGTQNTMYDSQTFGQNATKQTETKSDNTEMQTNQDTTTGMAGIMEHLRNTVAEVLPEENRDVVANRIMSQITENIRTQATPEMKSLELQLEPEHLGKVTISIMSKAGHITAEIAAQTQVAKEAIEGQLAILKDNLQQQGVKVESIEVTIASHSFEENLEKGNENHSGQQNERRHRRMLSDDIADGMNQFIPESESLEETVSEDLGANVSYLA